MIRFKTGDLLREDADALVNTVNCVGVMGRGVALQFKKAFPANFAAYKTACDQGEVVPGKMFVTTREALTGPRFIVNFPTKRHWKGKSRIEDVEAGLAALKAEIVARDIRSIALPPLGSGLGGLPWADVRQRIEDVLGDLNIDVIVFEPGGAPDAKVMARTREAPEMTPGRASLVTLVDRYLNGLLSPFITLLELHKLMYFLQTAGQPLRLKYKKHHYGPYAQNLSHVLHAIEGHLISGYADGGDDPTKQIELVPGATTDAKRHLSEDTETDARFNRVSALVEGFESPFGLELLSSVHWVVHAEGASDAEAAITKTYEWNARKRRFSERQIRLAFDHLQKHGWVT